MWRIIQTYFIGASVLLTAALFFCRFATVISTGGEELGIMYYEKIPYTVMLIMLLTAGVCAVFSYRQPILQARVCMLNALMLIGFQIWLGVDFLRFRDVMVFSPTMLFPLIGVLLNILAARRALLDGMTIQAVRSMKQSPKKRASANR